MSALSLWSLGDEFPCRFAQCIECGGERLQLGVSRAPDPRRDGPFPHTHHCQGHGMLCPTAVGTFPMGTWLIALSKAHPRQGQPPNCCFSFICIHQGTQFSLITIYTLHSRGKPASGRRRGKTCRNSIKIFRWQGLLAATLLPRVREKSIQLCAKLCLNLAFPVSLDTQGSSGSGFTDIHSCLLPWCGKGANLTLILLQSLFK